LRAAPSCRASHRFRISADRRSTTGWGVFAARKRPTSGHVEALEPPIVQRRQLRQKLERFKVVVARAATFSDLMLGSALARFVEHQVDAPRPSGLPPRGRPEPL